MIDDILSWADDHPEFDTSFVYSLQDDISSGLEPTPRQLQALENIIREWRVHDD